MKHIIFLFSIICSYATAQDFTFSNSHQSLIALNPSFAGSNGNLRYQAIYRGENYNFFIPYNTFYNSVDMYLKRLHGGLALAYSHDDQGNGLTKTDRIDLTYAQHLSFINHKLKIIPALQMSVFQKTLNMTNIVYGDLIDPRRGNIWDNPGFVPPFQQAYQKSITRSNLDFTGSLMVDYQHAYFGVSVFHFTQPEEGFYGSSQLPYRLSLFTSYNFNLGKKVLINAMYRFEKQSNFYYHRLNVQALLFNHLITGLGVTTNRGISYSIGYRHNYFTVSAGYEFGDTSIPNNLKSYELAASFTLRKKDDRKLVKDFERW